MPHTAAPRDLLKTNVHAGLRVPAARSAAGPCASLRRHWLSVLIYFESLLIVVFDSRGYRFPRSRGSILMRSPALT